MAKRVVNNEDLIRCDSEDLPDDLIGAAVFINEKEIVEHAAIFVRYNGTNQVFHYDGQAILIDEVEEGEWYFFKELLFINPEEVRIVLAHCELVRENAVIRYGYFYNGNGLFDLTNGLYIDAKGMPERMTCVGFCLNFLNSYLGRQFFYFEDWEIYHNAELGLYDEDYIEKFIDKAKKYQTDINEDELINGIRRILPVEYLTGGFSRSLPVRKTFTDIYHPEVQDILLRKIA